ncbi:LuxR family transcriptional regulator [uncultured Roseobacter sp.]|uniref:helix-turn-helix transcriptional regulator n=1 Tax=uncultured Roseobacter sp. TaxID=114847 RepID=UPI00262A2CEE|nr:LuxR family transcriptional regulator [uncultured Roseobacter sp.]
MSGEGSLNAFVLLCRETDRVSVLWHHTLHFLQVRGIEMVSYHSDHADAPSSQPLGIVTEGFPERWVCQYIETELHLIDPIPELTGMIARPFFWSEAPALTRLSEQGEAYMQTLLGSGLGDGVAMRVHGPNMRNAYVGMGFGRQRPELAPGMVFELQCAAQIAHLRYCELTESAHASAETLSPREHEVLRWIARGKSTSVIAEILGISRHSVDTLTRRIFEKLEVNDRTTAAIRGLGSGLLHFHGGQVV